MSSDGSPAQRLLSHSDRLFNGTLWMVAMRWGIRLLGLLSIVVLARLLDKQDFGLVAMATAVIALPQALLQMGVEQAVIREQDPDKSVYNTAWTIRAGQMALVAALVYAGAPWIASFYDDPRILDILYVLALVVLLQGLENIWVVAFRKNYQFQRDFLYNVACKVLGVAVTIALAFWLRSYWALVYGQATTAILRVVLSYAMAPAMARPDLSRWRLIWGFSQWSLVKGFAVYTISHADRLVLGRLVGAEMVGAYTIARQVAEMPMSEISMPVNRTLSPGFSNLQREPKRLAVAIAKSVGAVATAVFPIALGLAMTAEHVVPVALGPGWESVVPMLELLAVAAMFSAVGGVLGNALTVVGHVRATAIFMWIRALLLLAAGVPAVLWYGAEGMAAAFLASEAAAFVILLGFCRRLQPEVTFGLLLQAVLRPSMAVTAMVLAVAAARAAGVEAPALQLAAEVAAGAAAYTAVLMLTWLAMGRPDGLERIVINRLPRLGGRPSQASG